MAFEPPDNKSSLNELPLIIWIYGLYWNDIPLYVGKSAKPKRRFREHRNCKDTGCGSSDIPEDKRDYIMKILDVCLAKNGHEREAYWVSKLKPEYNKIKYRSVEEQAAFALKRSQERYDNKVGRITPRLTQEELVERKKEKEELKKRCVARDKADFNSWVKKGSIQRIEAESMCGSSASWSEIHSWLVNKFNSDYPK